MINCMISAPQSGGGKTIMTCALLAALKRKGLNPCAFKCGPDYIDPMFHRSVLGLESHNLDLFLSSEETVRSLFSRYSAEHGAAICEGVMGLYDGLGGTTTRASAWHLANTLQLPVLLVLRPKGASLTLAATVRGLQNFRPDSHVVGILLNECRPMLYQTLAPMLERETGLPVLGYLPPMEEARLPSRHLGLYTAQELKDLATRVERLGQQAEETLDLPRIMALCNRSQQHVQREAALFPSQTRIAVARDEAFCFCYAETLDALRLEGAEPVFFSPLHDATLPPDCGGIYLPGGYPELYAKKLSQNIPMRQTIRKAVQQGMPTVAECGGFLYLGQTLQDSQGQSWPMVGALPGQGFPTDHLVRFGYAVMTAQEDNLLFSVGTSVPMHEFHYWYSTQNGQACIASKPLGKRQWSCGFATPTLFASFAHLYMAGAPRMARRFSDAAARYERK